MGVLVWMFCVLINIWVFCNVSNMFVLLFVVFLVYILEIVLEILKKVKLIFYNKYRIIELLIDILYEKVYFYLCLFIIYFFYVEV